MPGTAAGCSRSSGIISARSCNRNCYRSSGTNYANSSYRHNCRIGPSKPAAAMGCSESSTRQQQMFTLSGNISTFFRKRYLISRKSRQLSQTWMKLHLKSHAISPIPREFQEDYNYFKKACKERFEPTSFDNERRLQFRHEVQEAEGLDAFYERLLQSWAKVLTYIRSRPTPAYILLDI